MNTIQPDDVNIVFGLPPEAFEWDVIGIDTEWFGQEKSRLHRPHGTFGCLGCTPNGRDVYMIFDTDEIQMFYDRIDAGTHAYHNAQYDIRQLRKYANLSDRKKIWDTQLLEQIRYSGYYTDFSLNDLARRYLNVYMDKDVRESFSDNEQTKMTDDQIFYAAVDIVCTWMIANAQREQIDEDDLGIWEHIERPFLWTMLDTKGIYFDREKWTARYTQDLIDAERLDNELPFNPRSHTQVKAYFKEKYGLKLDGTAEGVFKEYITNTCGIDLDKATDEELQSAIEEYPETKPMLDILNARGLSKASKTYGAKWVDGIEEDGRIYPSWKQIGTETGRMSAGGDFPIQTMPHEKKYRECVIAAPGHTLAINDWSSQEPKELAYITGDPILIRIFRDKKDVYIEVGFEIFDERFDKKDPRRQQMKSIILGISYGMSKYGLARKLGIDVDEAEDLLYRFFQKFPKVKRWVDECSIWKPYATTILGRKFWLNPYSNGWERNAQNFPMQGSAGDCAKLSANKLRKLLGYNPCVVYMHDELVCEFPDDELERGAQLMTEVMIERQEWMSDNTIPGGIEQFIAKDWSAK